MIFQTMKNHSKFLLGNCSSHHHSGFPLRGSPPSDPSFHPSLPCSSFQGAGPSKACDRCHSNSFSLAWKPDEHAVPTIFTLLDTATALRKGSAHPDWAVDQALVVTEDKPDPEGQANAVSPALPPSPAMARRTYWPISSQIPVMGHSVNS